MRVRVTPGAYTLEDEGFLRKYSKNAIPGTFPRRFWDIVTTEDEEDFTSYLNGQEDFAPEPEPVPEPMHVCARCQRPCKAQYKHCYRCAQYLRVKARIA